MRALLVLAALGSSLLAACEPDLGACDQAAAKAVYYDGLGQPAYAGQALVMTTCGGAGGFCHVASARGAQRLGVPAGYDFDVALATTEAASHTLRAGIARVRDEASDMWGAVERGDMPTRSSFHRNAAVYRDADGLELAALDTSAGKDLLRNWLACGAPVVERTTARPAGVAPIGDIVEATAPRLAPTWDSLYANVVGPTCSPCHSGAQPSGALDLGDIETGYVSLVGDGEGRAAMGPSCGSTDETRVVPGDPAGSLIIHKLEGVDHDGAAVCGERMPLGMDPLSDEKIRAFRDWIFGGALRDDA